MPGPTGSRRVSGGEGNRGQAFLLWFLQVGAGEAGKEGLGLASLDNSVGSGVQVPLVCTWPWADGAHGQ